MTTQKRGNDSNTPFDLYTPANMLYYNKTDRYFHYHYNISSNLPNPPFNYLLHNSNQLLKDRFNNKKNKSDDNIRTYLCTSLGITTSAGHFRTVWPSVETALKIKQS